MMIHTVHPNRWTGYIDKKSTYNCKCSGIEEAVLPTLNDLALLADTDEVGGFDETKSSAEWIHPECVGFNGVSVGYVALERVSLLTKQEPLWYACSLEMKPTGNTLIIAVLPEDTERRCETTFPVCTFLVFIIERRRP